MSCLKCTSHTVKIPSSSTRISPTFTHSQIFPYPQSEPLAIKCSPTFHSTVLDTQNYNIITNHSNTPAKARPLTSLQTTVYLNNSRNRRVQDLNTDGFVGAAQRPTRNNWWDSSKFDQIKNIITLDNRSFSKQRKRIQLQSNLVFTDYNYGLDHKHNNNKHSDCFQSSLNGNNIHIQRQTVKASPLLPNNSTISISDDQAPRNATFIQPAKLVNQNGQAENEKRKDFKKIADQTFSEQNKNSKQLKVKGKKIESRPHSALRVVKEKPTFTVIRRSRVAPY